MKLPNFFSTFSLLGVLLLVGSAAPSLPAAEAPASVEQWDIFELQLKGPSEGNPFTEVQFTTEFTNGTKTIEVAGFYDGDGVYRVRFMPESPGEWRYETRSNRWSLTGKTGSFHVTPAKGANHGPVHVFNTYHFAYADGTPFNVIGTTCYSWTHRSDAYEEQTLKTLASAPFNKIRMAVFPQTHGTKTMPPPRWPYQGTPPHTWDYARFNPEFFRHLEKRIGQLRELGIEADLILFHPYDDDRAWGFDTMDTAHDDLYLRYVTARLAAYRNVWWSMANEYDFLRTKTESDWDHIFQTVQQSDPYGHLRSIHNGRLIYNQNHPWVTHVSMQNGMATEDPGRAEIYRDAYRKPIVYDEMKYEGDHVMRWAQLSGQEMVQRFWNCTVAGTYGGHGEYFRNAEDLVWVGQGVALHGESPARLAFLKKILDEGPASGVDPIDQWQDPRVGGKAGEFYLIYFGLETPKSWTFDLYRDGLTDGMEFRIDVIDTWSMTVTPVDGVFVAKKKDRYRYVERDGKSVPLPGKPYQAIRIRYVGGTAPANGAKPVGEP